MAIVTIGLREPLSKDYSLKKISEWTIYSRRCSKPSWWRSKWETVPRSSISSHRISGVRSMRSTGRTVRCCRIIPASTALSSPGTTGISLACTWTAWHGTRHHPREPGIELAGEAGHCTSGCRPRATPWSTRWVRRAPTFQPASWTRMPSTARMTLISAGQFTTGLNATSRTASLR